MTESAYNRVQSIKFTKQENGTDEAMAMLTNSKGEVEFSMSDPKFKP